MLYFTNKTGKSINFEAAHKYRGTEEDKYPRGSRHQSTSACPPDLKSKESSIITLCSSSGDANIAVLAFPLPYEFWNRVLLDDGCKGDKKLVGLSRKDIEKDLVDALVGFYTFTKYDYVSSFAEEKKSVGEKSWECVSECIFESRRKLAI